jgi:hypothetical protein
MIGGVVVSASLQTVCEIALALFAVYGFYCACRELSRFIFYLMNRYQK